LALLGAERTEVPDNRNDQARAHLLARDSAEEKIKKTKGEVLSKIRAHPQLTEIINIKKLIDGRNIGCPCK
jgi:hypothetical protein